MVEWIGTDCLEQDVEVAESSQGPRPLERQLADVGPVAASVLLVQHSQVPRPLGVKDSVVAAPDLLEGDVAQSIDVHGMVLIEPSERVPKDVSIGGWQVAVRHCVAVDFGPPGRVSEVDVVRLQIVEVIPGEDAELGGLQADLAIALE